MPSVPNHLRRRIADLMGILYDNSALKTLAIQCGVEQRCPLNTAAAARGNVEDFLACIDRFDLWRDLVDRLAVDYGAYREDVRVLTDELTQVLADRPRRQVRKVVIDLTVPASTSTMRLQAALDSLRKLENHYEHFQVAWDGYARVIKLDADARLLKHITDHNSECEPDRYRDVLAELGDDINELRYRARDANGHGEGAIQQYYEHEHDLASTREQLNQYTVPGHAKTGAFQLLVAAKRMRSWWQSMLFAHQLRVTTQLREVKGALEEVREALDAVERTLAAERDSV